MGNKKKILTLHAMFQLAAKDNEIQRLLDELSNQLQEYQVDRDICKL